MMPTRLEVNFRRLLSRMEEMADNEVGSEEWRFDRYLSTLRKQLNDLGSEPSSLRPSPEQLKQFRDKVAFLEQYWASCQASSLEERRSLTATMVVPPVPPSAPAPSTSAPPQGAAGDGVRFRETDIAARSRSSVQQAMRDELFGDAAKDEPRPEVSEKAVIDHQERLQERLTEGMVDMARSLKETAAAAGQVVRADISQLEATTRQAESNISLLAVEGKRLEVLANTAAAVCSCTVWCALIMVTVTFVSMVVFIRIFPKG